VKGTVAAAYTSTCAVATCSAEGDLCEPCDGGGNCHPSCVGPGSCQSAAEGDLRCVVSCSQVSCTSSTQCAADQFCAVNAGGPGVSACCEFCKPAIHIPILCSAQGDFCGNLLDSQQDQRACRIGPGDYIDFATCEPSVEGDLRCQTFGCEQPASNCTSSSQCPPGDFCGLDGGGPGVNACCPLCQ
jgi:hypothetical protein